MAEETPTTRKAARRKLPARPDPANQGSSAAIPQEGFVAPYNPRARVNISPRMRALINDPKGVENLDDEEIKRMQLRAEDGSFKGRPVRWMPRELAMAWANEQRRRMAEWFTEALPQAQQTLQYLMDPAIPLFPGDGVRVRAAEIVLDRALGKVGSETHITVDKGKSFDDFIEAALVDTEAEE